MMWCQQVLTTLVTLRQHHYHAHAHQKGMWYTGHATTPSQQYQSACCIRTPLAPLDLRTEERSKEFCYMRAAEKFVDWWQCADVMQRDAMTVMPICSGGGNVVVAWSSFL
jgi:hypothetical protein